MFVISGVNRYKMEGKVVLRFYILSIYFFNMYKIDGTTSQLLVNRIDYIRSSRNQRYLSSSKVSIDDI